MEIVDFGVAIEEVMDKECSAYECLVHDEDDVGYLWSFVIEDSIGGFVGIEENAETFNLNTVTIGLHLRDATNFSRDQLVDILEMNTGMINASFGITKFSLPLSEDEDDLDDDIFGIFADEAVTEREMLVVQSRMPLGAFEPVEFIGYVQNLLFQSELIFMDSEDDEMLDEPGVEMTHSADLVDLVGNDEVGGDDNYEDDFDDDYDDDD